MNQNIITYLNENKEKYSKDALVTELKKAGYAEGDIAESMAQVFGGVVPAPVTAKTSFWNFKDKKVYTKASEKWADFLFGVFAVIVFSYVAVLFFVYALRQIPFGSSAFFLLNIILATYFFSHRRLIFYGMVVSFLIVPFILPTFHSLFTLAVYGF